MADGRSAPAGFSSAHALTEALGTVVGEVPSLPLLGSGSTAGAVTPLDESYSNEVTWYGPNLRRTLTELSMEQLTFDKTYEGYTAWELALRCAYWTWVIARALAGANDEYPCSPADFPRVRGERTRENWLDDLRCLDEQHERLKKATRALSDAQLKAQWIDEDGVAQDGNVARQFMGVAIHDADHTAQIRSMGIPELAEEKR